MAFRNSTTEDVLNVFLIDDGVPVDNIESINKDHLKDCDEKSAVVKTEEYGLDQIEEELANGKLERANHTTTLEAQVWNLMDNIRIHWRSAIQYFHREAPQAGSLTCAQADHPPVSEESHADYSRLKLDFKKNFVAFVERRKAVQAVRC